MHPILLEVPSLGITIASYNALMLLAAVVWFWLAPRWVVALEGLDGGRVRRAMLPLGLAFFVGARLHFVLNQWKDFADHPLAALSFWSGGLHAPGGIALLALAGPLVLRRQGLPVGRFADGFAPAVGITIALARLGCFLEGCCFGTPCAWPWCLSFPRGSYIYQFHTGLGLLPPGAAHTLPIHPLQLYFAGAGLLLTLVALWLRPRKRYDGEVALVGLVLYSASAALLEFLRADYQPRVYWGSLPQLTWVAFVMTAASLAALAGGERAHRRGAVPSERSLRIPAKLAL